MRILLVSKRYIVEADVTTGRYVHLQFAETSLQTMIICTRDVVSHEAKYITAIKTIEENGRPAIKVEYSPPRAGTETRADVKDITTYVLDDEDER